MRSFSPRRSSSPRNGLAKDLQKLPPISPENMVSRCSYPVAPGKRRSCGASRGSVRATFSCARVFRLGSSFGFFVERSFSSAMTAGRLISPQPLAFPPWCCLDRRTRKFGHLGERRFIEFRILSTATPARAIAALFTTSRNASSVSRFRRSRYPSMPPYARPLPREPPKLTKAELQSSFCNPLKRRAAIKKGTAK